MAESARTTRRTPDDERAITAFTKLLRYETVSATSPQTGAYRSCAEYLKSLLLSTHNSENEPGCFECVQFLDESPSHSPVVVAKWGARASADTNADDLPIILLNSHYDVVPVIPSDWTVPAFEGEIHNDVIYGRGAQDMKSVCIQYIFAILKLHKSGFRPRRSVWLTFVPDEEIGGSGMACLLSSKLFHETWGGADGIALALDEGLASPSEVYSVFYGERLPWWVKVSAKGKSGHGSRFIEDTAVEQILHISKLALEFRTSQRDLLFGNENGSAAHENCSHAVVAKKRRKNQMLRNDEQEPTPKTKTLGDVTTLNITSLQMGVENGNGGYVSNIVPPRAECTFDIRISPHTNPSEISTLMDTWCQECSLTEDANVNWSFIGGENSSQTHASTSTDITINPWYGVFVDALTEMNLRCTPEVFPAATDSRFLRALGIRALGFSPMRNTEILLHENDECLSVETFLEGIDVYVGILREFGSA